MLVSAVVRLGLLDPYPSLESNRMILLVLINKTLGVGISTGGEASNLLIRDDNYADRVFPISNPLRLMPIDLIDKSSIVHYYHTPPDLGVIAWMTKFKP